MELLKVSGISKQQAGAFILKDISFTLPRFRKIAIAGETGSGKSTLLKVIAGLSQPDTGEVLFEDKRVEGPLEVLIPGHEGIAYLSQYFELRHHYRVEEILSYANQLTEDEARNIYAICRINHLLQRRTDELSGGEAQRIALARLLTTAPRLLLLDEPFSNLDMIHKNLLKSVIHDIGESLEITCMLISHDPHDILSWADELFIMKAGQLLQRGAPQQVYYQPVDAYAAGLLGKYNLVPPDGLRHLSALPGITSNGKSLFARPEQFTLTAPQPDALKGKVQAITFWGGYYDIAVQVPGKTMVTVRMITCDVKKGDTVYVGWRGTDVWYI
ncbi:ABC transporter ATP-binding protein [Chitinophaga japonensis]|uniref:ABC-type Fe3+/spermidine/putrescine transport system ATPase subunit n=1 Tax=Chitinophaga japonensis TaxID=104662 RepID=A0A562SZ10_CHIJA|nr:ABC transporter ATP-binding protein [Chitinophaga japonensis]TWI86403.1 ABC-type Fe3+/spermidine/putrescine transport system ATPase subunit [Chitinophaga japonensis]